jgi:hypothetical protein
MKFTVPAAQDREQAEKVWTAVRDFLASLGHKTTSRRIAGIMFVHNGKSYDLSVGDMHPDLGEPVLVILEGLGLHYICTPNRGVIRGDPYLVGQSASVVEFEAD